MARYWDTKRSTARWHVLKVPGARKALRADREAAIVETRPGASGWWQQHPRPYSREMAQAADEGPQPDDSQLGFDAEGRLVLVQDDHSPRGTAHSWGEGWGEVVALNSGRAPDVHHFNFEEGRLVEEIAIERRRADGELDELDVHVTRWDYDDQGRPVRALHAWEPEGLAAGPGEEPGRHWWAQLYRFTYDADGGLAQILWGNCREGFAKGLDADAAQAQARADEAELFVDMSVTYDARTQRLEHDLPAAGRAFDGVAEPLAEAFHGALEPVLAEMGDAEFVLIHARGSVIEAVVARGAFGQRARRMGFGEQEMSAVLPMGPKGTVKFDSTGIAGPELLRLLRRGNQALRGTGRTAPHSALIVEVAARLGASPWAGLASPPRFIAGSMQMPDRYIPSFASEGRPQLALIDALSSREQLTSMLLNAGLDEDEVLRVAQDARWGLRLETGGRGASRLGGAPILPPGTTWPMVDGRPLTHLATLAFDELPAFEDRDLLPADGLLSFFVDLSEEGFVDVVGPESGRRELVRFLATPSDGPREIVVPPGPAVPEVRVRFVPVLQLRELGWGWGEVVLGLDALAEHVVQGLRGRLGGNYSDHQLLGHPITIQDDPRSKEQVTLLRIATDHAIDFSFQDGGDLHLFAATDDLRAGRWDQVTVVGSSM